MYDKVLHLQDVNELNVIRYEKDVRYVSLCYNNISDIIIYYCGNNSIWLVSYSGDEYGFFIYMGIN